MCDLCNLRFSPGSKTFPVKNDKLILFIERNFLEFSNMKMRVNEVIICINSRISRDKHYTDVAKDQAVFYFHFHAVQLSKN